MHDDGQDVRPRGFPAAGGRRPHEVVAPPRIGEQAGLTVVTQREHDRIPPGLEAVAPRDRAYVRARSTSVHRGAPALVLRPRTPEQVAEALAYAREQRVPLSIRSGGHGIGGRSTNDGGIVVDVGALDDIEVHDLGSGKVRLGPGARWGEVAQVLQPLGLGISSCDHGDVGVGGLATTGGIGFLGRLHGLTIDRVTAAELVLADGREVRADADTHPDLLWAVRGAGRHFGIVTALELEARPVGDVVLSIMTFDARDVAGLLERWGAIVEAAPRELTSFLTLSPQHRVAQLRTVVATDRADEVVAALRPLSGAGPLLDEYAEVLPYAALLPCDGVAQSGGSGEAAFRAGLAERMTSQVAGAVAALAASGEAPMIQVRQVGGAINDVDPMATAYAHRRQNFCLSAAGHSLAALNRHWDATVHPLLDGTYASFDTDTRPERLRDAFPPATLARLRGLKAVYDPEGLFGQDVPLQAAGPAAAAAA